MECFGSGRYKYIYGATTSCKGATLLVATSDTPHADVTMLSLLLFTMAALRPASCQLASFTGSSKWFVVTPAKTVRHMNASASTKKDCHLCEAITLLVHPGNVPAQFNLLKTKPKRPSLMLLFVSCHLSLGVVSVSPLLLCGGRHSLQTAFFRLGIVDAIYIRLLEFTHCREVTPFQMHPFLFFSSSHFFPAFENSSFGSRLNKKTKPGSE